MLLSSRRYAHSSDLLALWVGQTEPALIHSQGLQIPLGASSIGWCFGTVLDPMSWLITTMTNVIRWRTFGSVRLFGTVSDVMLPREQIASELFVGTWKSHLTITHTGLIANSANIVGRQSGSLFASHTLLAVIQLIAWTLGASVVQEERIRLNTCRFYVF